MSKLTFVRSACDLYSAQAGLVPESWLGPNAFHQAACFNWALWGAVDPSPFNLDQAVVDLDYSNSKPNRRRMVGDFVERSDLTKQGDGMEGELHWGASNQLFIGSATSAAEGDRINWSHWWIEIRNVAPGDRVWEGPSSLLLETVPGKALTVRRGQEQSDYTGDYTLEVAIPVESLSARHYQTMQAISQARVMIRDRNGEFPGGVIGEDRQEYLHESGLWDRLIASSEGVARIVTGILPPTGYVRPSIRSVSGEPLVISGGSLSFAVGAPALVD